MYKFKTDFREYLQCDKCLWLKKNEPDWIFTGSGYTALWEAPELIMED
jgi:hypothetical protein